MTAISKTKAFQAAQVGRMPVSSALPMLRFIATEYNLNLNRLADFNLAKKILIIYSSDN